MCSPLIPIRILLYPYFPLLRLFVFPARAEAGHDDASRRAPRTASPKVGGGLAEGAGGRGAVAALYSEIFSVFFVEGGRDDTIFLYFSVS